MMWYTPGIALRVGSGCVDEDFAVMIPAGRIIQNQDLVRPRSARLFKCTIAAVMVDDEKIRRPLRRLEQRFLFAPLNKDVRAKSARRQRRHRRNGLAPDREFGAPSRLRQPLGEGQAARDMSGADAR